MYDCRFTHRVTAAARVSRHVVAGVVFLRHPYKNTRRLMTSEREHNLPSSAVRATLLPPTPREIDRQVAINLERPRSTPTSMAQPTGLSIGSKPPAHGQRLGALLPELETSWLESWRNWKLFWACLRCWSGAVTIENLLRNREAIFISREREGSHAEGRLLGAETPPVANNVLSLGTSS